MNPDRPVEESNSARRWYRRLLNLYPGTFRARYADEMLGLFGEQWNRISREGRFAQGRYWFHVAADLAGTMPREWLRGMSLGMRVVVGLIGFGLGLNIFVAIRWHAIPVAVCLAVLGALFWVFRACAPRLNLIVLYFLMGAWGPLGYLAGRVAVSHARPKSGNPFVFGAFWLMAAAVILRSRFTPWLSGRKSPMGAGLFGVSATLAGLYLGQIDRETLSAVNGILLNVILCVMFFGPVRRVVLPVGGPRPRM